MKSIGFRFLMVGLLTVLMAVPLILAGEVINERSDYNRDTVRELGEEWGGAQLLSGPQLIIPVEGPVTREEAREVVEIIDGKEVTRIEKVEVTEVQRKRSIYAYPEEFDLDLATKSEERARGIFAVPVFVADARIGATFDFDAIGREVFRGETILWDKAQLRVTLRNNKALRGEAELLADGRALALEPLTRGGQAGVIADLGDPREVKRFALSLKFNGSDRFQVTPVGRTSTVQMKSDWPHPSFQGSFLPTTREIRNDGFTADWVIPHLARTLPQISRMDTDPDARALTAFGVQYFQPNDFYQKAYRAARYGLLFIALTFLTVLLIEDRTGRGTHPVQYIFIGLAQSVFLLLMVAYAEQIGFAWAYAVSAGATITLLTMFGHLALKLGIRALVLGVMLVMLYGVLYLILRSADYALLAGATLAFAALAGTMYLTRNENWYGEPGGGFMAWLNGTPSQPQVPVPASPSP